MADLHELVAAYAVDALDASERGAFEAHLEGCAACARELALLQPATTALAEDASATPPAAMKASVLEAIGSTRQQPSAETSPASAAAPRRFAFPRWVTGLVAAAAAVVVLAVSGVIGGGVSLADVTEAPDSAAVALDGDIGSARFVYSDALDTGYFLAASLPSPTSAETYQLWLIGEGGPVSAGTFRPGEDGSVEVKVEGDIAAGKTLGLTVEPAGGSPAPTGDVLLAEVLG